MELILQVQYSMLTVDTMVKRAKVNFYDEYFSKYQAEDKRQEQR